MGVKQSRCSGGRGPCYSRSCTYVTKIISGVLHTFHLAIYGPMKVQARRQWEGQGGLPSNNSLMLYTNIFYNVPTSMPFKSSIEAYSAKVEGALQTTKLYTGSCQMCREGNRLLR